MILLAADFVIAACGLVGSAALSLLVTVIMARAVGVEEFGLYSWAFAYVNLWAPVMDGGASLLAVREVARGRGEVVAGLLALKPLQLAVPLGLMLGAAGAAGVEPGVLWLITLLAVSSAVDTCFGLASAAFRGRGRFGRDALHQLGQRSLFALLAAGALSWGAGVVGVAGARAASLAVAAVTALGFLGRDGAIRWDGAARWLRLEGWGRIRPLVPMLVIDLMTQALARSAHLILRMTRGLGEVGVYAAASRLVEGLGLLPAAVGIALLPRLAAAHRRGPEVVAAELGAGLRSASLLAVVAAGAGLLWAEELVTRVFGGAYAASAVPLRILMGVLVLMMVNAALRTALLAVGGEGAYARGVTLAALLGVGLNMAVTPWWGASGSALASLGAETALCAAAAVGLRRRRIAGVPGPYWGRLTLVSLIALAFLWGVKTVSPDAALGLTVLAALAGVVTTLTRRLRGLLPGALPPPGG